MRFLKYFSITIFLFTVVSIILFFNLGKILDVSQTPTKSDIIVCLGGGDKYRIQHAVDLYNQEYSLQKQLILTGDDRTKKIKEQNLPDKRIEYILESKHLKISYKRFLDKGNTKDEIVFIKKYLLEHNLQSAIIITDAPHTRRVKTLINLIKINGDEKLQFSIVSSNAPWWNSKSYFTDKKAQVFVLHETLKLIYTYLAYGLGMESILKENKIPDSIKKLVYKETYFYLKDK